MSTAHMEVSFGHMDRADGHHQSDSTAQCGVSHARSTSSNVDFHLHQTDPCAGWETNQNAHGGRARTAHGFSGFRSAQQHRAVTADVVSSTAPSPSISAAVRATAYPMPTNAPGMRPMATAVPLPMPLPMNQLVGQPFLCGIPIQAGVLAGPPSGCLDSQQFTAAGLPEFDAKLSQATPSQFK